MPALPHAGQVIWSLPTSYVGLSILTKAPSISKLQLQPGSELNINSLHSSSPKGLTTTFVLYSYTPAVQLGSGTSSVGALQ